MGSLGERTDDTFVHSASTMRGSFTATVVLTEVAERQSKVLSVQSVEPHACCRPPTAHAMEPDCRQSCALVAADSYQNLAAPHVLRTRVRRQGSASRWRRPTHRASSWIHATCWDGRDALEAKEAAFVTAVVRPHLEVDHLVAWTGWTCEVGECC